jgi:hypothetical protein
MILADIFAFLGIAFLPFAIRLISLCVFRAILSFNNNWTKQKGDAHQLFLPRIQGSTQRSSSTPGFCKRHHFVTGGTRVWTTEPDEKGTQKEGIHVKETRPPKMQSSNR